MFYRIPIDSPPYVSLAGHIRYREGWSGEYCHRDNILLYIRAGSFRYEFGDGEAYAVGAGCCHLIPAGTKYLVTVTSECEFYYIHFRTSRPLAPASEQEVIELAKRMKKSQLGSRLQRDYPDARPEEICVSQVVSVGPEPEKIHYRFSRCEETRNGTHELDRLRTENVFMSLLISLSDDSTSSLPKTSVHPESLTKITGYIGRNYTKPISLCDLAEEFGYSKQYIMRLFRLHLGTTVSDYVNSVKLRHALDLLRFTGMSVGEVAYSLGYSSGYYFSRVFREAFSMSPTEYRKTASWEI